MNDSEFVKWQVENALYESRVRLVQLAGEELVKRGANSFVVNEVVYQETMKMAGERYLTQLRKVKQSEL